MFAAILRRWRLVTPLALAVLAIAVVANGFLVPVSAHNAKFHFFGRAFALADDSTVLPDTACDTGFIRKVGSSSIDTGHCFGVDGPGEPGAGITGSGRLESIFADSTVVSTHGNTKGHVLAKVDMEEAAGAHNTNLHGCNAPFNGGVDGGFPAFSNNPCVYDGPTSPTTGTSVSNTANGVTASTCGVTLRPAQGRVFSLLDDSFGTANCSDTLFWADLIQVAAEAECHTRLNGTTHASVASAIELSDAAVREDNGLRYIGPQGSVGPAGQANTTFTISGFNFGELIIRDILVIINEQHIVQDGPAAAIKVNAVHLVGTDDDGFVKFNFILGGAFAGIHCARRLDGQDTLVVPGA